MSRPTAPAWAITREHLPAHVQEHVPGDLEDAQVPFWWAAFSKGWEAALQPQHTPDHDHGPPIEELQASMTTEANYGDEIDPIEATADVVADRTRVAIDMGMQIGGPVPQDVLEQALWADEPLRKWRDGEGELDGRVLEAMLTRALTSAKLIKADSW